MFSKIVVGVDGSKPSEEALKMACDLAQKYESEIHLVHTPQPQTVAFATGAVAGYHTVTTMPSEHEVKEACDKIVDSATAVAKDAGQEISSVHLDRGNPVNEIVKHAESCGADLIVTGRRGLGNIGSLLQGSTTQGVNHNAKCACLSVA